MIHTLLDKGRGREGAVEGGVGYPDEESGRLVVTIDGVVVNAEGGSGRFAGSNEDLSLPLLYAEDGGLLVYAEGGSGTFAGFREGTLEIQAEPGGVLCAVVGALVVYADGGSGMLAALITEPTCEAGGVGF